MSETKDGTKICGFHLTPLIEMARYGDNSSGLENLSAWICPVSKRPIFRKG
ncbi:MAG: hypothetical protein ACRD2U_02030 [Terriglobales bacterium]